MKKMKFGKKLLLTLLPIVILSIGAITWISYKMSQNTILGQQADNMEQLVGKTIQTLGVWMEDRTRDSLIFSETGVFIAASQGKRTDECAPRLLTYHKLAPVYENIFLALPTGEIVFDAIGGKSVGVNISKLPEYAVNVEKARQGMTWIGQVNTSPATGRPVSLITSPVLSGGRLVGIMGTPVETNAFSEEFVGGVQIGRNGSLFMVDKDGRILAHKDKDKILKVNIKEFDFGKKILAQKKGRVEYTLDGEDRIAFFNVYDRNGWIVVADADKAEFLGPTLSIRNYSLLLGLAAVLLLIVAVWFRARAITKPLEKTVGNLNDIANGDLSHDVEEANLARGDEIGLLARGLQKVITSQRDRVALTQAIAMGRLDIEVVQASERDTLGKALKDMVASLSGIIRETNQAIDQVASGANEVSDSSQALSQGATQQAASLEEITSSMTQLSAQTLTNADNAGQANTLAQSARESAEAGNHQMQEMITAMGGINEASREIAKIIKTIDDIAFQTNLLALNAAVEAARAGKHGKGFAVVAQEVRNLAGRSGKAAQETAELIEGTVKKVQNGTEILDRTGQSLSEIVMGITKATDLVGEIAAASNEQAQGIAQVNLGLSQIEKVTQQNTATSEQSASAADQLSSQAGHLKELMLGFKLTGQDDPNRKELRSSASNFRPPVPKKIGTGAQPPQARPTTLSKDRSLRPEDLISLDDDDFGKY